MKKLLLASALAIASVPSYAADAAPDYFAPPQCDKLDGGEYKECVAQEWEKHQQKEQPTARVTVQPLYPMREPATVFHGCGERWG